MDKNSVKTYYEKKVFYIQAEFIRDFLFSLLEKIEKTYLGDDIMSDTNKKEHFIWCITEVGSQFKEEGIDINLTDTFISKIYNFYNTYFYSVKKNKTNVDNLKVRLSNLININPGKTAKQVEDIVYYHKLFFENIGYEKEN